jgi:hypothetical protein
MKQTFIFFIALTFSIFGCEKKIKKGQKLSLDEINATNFGDTSEVNLSNTTTFNQIATAPNNVILTGLNNIRLVTVYKTPILGDRNVRREEGTTYFEENEYNSKENEFRYYMPGIDVIYGYNLVNIGHYNIEKNELTYFFKKPVLIRTLYFPGVKNDTFNKKKVARNFFFVSAYSYDSNNDSTISNKDLRQFYFINENNTEKVELLPTNFSAIRSQFDYKNDLMYIYARNDENKNGIGEKTEKVHIFIVKLSNPKVATKMI